MDRHIKVSIITVAYNSQATIKNTIDSVIKQTYQDIEYIVVDGDSTDDTANIVRSYGDKIALFISEPDKGLYDAMNKGICKATGDIIGILNSDDFYADDHVIQNVIDKIETTDADVCYADLNYVHPKQTSKIIRKWRSGNYSKKSFYYGWMPPHPTLFLSKQVYKKVGFFNLNFASSADYEMMLRIFLKNNFKVAYLPKTVVCMRAGGTSNVSLLNRIKANREDRRAWKINDLKPYFFTLFFKPLRKIFQYL